MRIRIENNKLRSLISTRCVPVHTSGRNRPFSLAIVFATLFVASAAFADTATSAWNGGTTNWSTAANWGSGLPSASISALFNSTFANQPQLTANGVAQGIWLATGVGQDMTIGTSDGTTQRTLNLAGTATLGSQTNAGIILDDSGNNNLTIGASSTDTLVVSLANNTGFYVNNAGYLTLQGNKNLAIVAYTLTLGGNNASGKIVISRAISGTGSVIVNTAGTVTLNNQNTLAGTTLVAGKLNINNAKALGVVATSTFAINGGTLDNTSGGALTMAYAYPITVGGNFAFAGSTNLNLGNGTVDLGGATRTITVNAATLTLGGVISNGGLTKEGTGTLTLSGVNTYTNTAVSAGTLEITKTNCLSDASSVSIATGAKMYLHFTGTNTIKVLKLGGNGMPKGVYGASDLGGTAFFTVGGSGKLNVTDSGLSRGTLISVF